MKSLQKRSKEMKMLSRFLGLCLAVVLVLTDCLSVYASGAEVSAGDGTVMSGMEGDNGDGVSDVGESGSAKTEDMGSVLGGDDTAVLGSGDVSGENDVSGGDALPRREPEVFYREPEPEHYGELVSYDAYSRTYHAGENRYVTVVGNDGTTYIDEEGSLCRVDNTLVENPVSLFSMGGAGASYVNRANAYMVLFPENIAAYEDSAFADCGITTESDDSAGGFGEGIAILCGDYQMLLYPAQGSFTEGTARGNAIRYSNVFSNVDYQYTVLANSVKEDIILLEKGEKNSFSYYVDACGLSVSLINNILYLYEAGDAPEQEAVFVLEAPEMEDAAGEVSFGVEMTFAETGGLYLVTVTADREWLDAPERVYPVRIDPTAIQVSGSAIRLACAEEGSPNAVIGDNQYPYVGYDDGITSGNYAGFRSRHLNCRTYFAIDYDFAALAAEAEITSAAFLVTQKTRWSRGTTEFGLFGVGEEWMPEGLSWNSQLDFTHVFLDSQAAAAVRGESLSFDVTEAVSAWVNGRLDNHGFVLKAMAEAPDAEAAAAGTKMQCEVFYNNASAAYAPKLVLSWTGEPTELSALTLDDTTIEIYPVVERSGDRSTSTLGVAAHGMAKPGSRVVYSLVNGTTGEVEAETSLVYPDSALYADAFPTALAYHRRLSNWQSEVFTDLVPGQVYYITAYAEDAAEYGVERGAAGAESSMGSGASGMEGSAAAGGVGKTVRSDSFILYEEGAFDLIPRIAAHYGVELDTVMADMQMQDALTRQGNLIFIRNPQNTAPYVAGELSDYWRSVIDGLLLGRAQYCEFGFEPVNLNTGNFYMKQTDAAMPDISGDFAITRQYNSMGAGYAGSFGFGWNTPFDERLGELLDGTILWLSGTGAIVAFTKEADGFRAPAGQTYTLTESGDGFAVTDTVNLEKHLFNAYGQLAALEDVCGNRTTLSYGMDGRLSAVTSPSGKIYMISLDGENRISAIGLPDGNDIGYGYDKEGNLVTVTDEAGDILRFSYDSAHRMTAWYDENANCVVENTYDEKGRVIRQTDAEGGVVSLSYGDGRTETVDANGNHTVYYYDSSFRTTRIEYADGSTESRSYNGQGYQSSVTDRQGMETMYTYTPEGRVCEETRQDGAQRHYTYNATGLPKTMTDYDGGTTTYSYDENNRLVSVTDAEGGRVSYAYDGENRPVSMTDACGNTRHYAYNGACISSMTDGEGNIWRYTYDAMNRRLTETDPLGNILSYTYDAKGRCTAETDAEGNTAYYVYDAAGNVTAITDREGNTSTFVYDKMNRMLSGMDPLGNTLTFTYDANGNRLTETDAAGNVVSYAYDNQNRVKTETDAEGRITAYTYDGADRTVSVTDRLGHTRLYAYDSVTGALVSQTDERGNKTVYELDVCGRMTGILYADGSRMYYAYDKLGRITALTDRLGLTISVSYDKCGNPVSLTEGGERTYFYEYDACGRLIKTVNPLGEITAYAYDGAGNLLSVTDGRGNSTHYSYDVLNRPAAVRDAMDGITSYAYDREGRPVTVTTPEGRRTAYVYDAVGQLVEIEEGQTHGGGTRRITYTYDSLSRVVSAADAEGRLASYDYDAFGGITRAEDALDNAHVYEYDAEGRLLLDIYPNGEKETFTYLATGEVKTYTDRYGVKTTFAYDAMGRVTESSDTAGNRTAYAYDAAGNLVRQTDVLGRSIFYEYDVFGRVAAIRDVDGAKTHYVYDALDRLVCVTDAAGNETTYAYDGAGNLIRTTKPGEAVCDYAYDALNRLDEKRNPEGETTVYAYDGDGNLTAQTDGNGVRTTLAYDGLNRPVAYTDGNGGQTFFTYDSRNNLISTTTPEGITVRRTYDAAGNLLAVTDGTGETWQYAYDALYRLIKQVSPLGVVENYEYDGHDVVTRVTDALGAVTVYEVNANGQVEKQILPNGGIYAYTYDEAHRLTGITTPLGYETAFSYSLGDDIVKQSDSLDRVTLYEYDVLHNLVQVTDAEGGITSYGYDGRNNRISMVNALGAVYTFDYDRADRLTVLTDPQERVTSASYDMAGSITSITMPGDRTIRYGYDGNYNTVSVTDPMGHVYGYSYDGDNRMTGAANPLGETASYAYDGAGRLISYTDRLGLTEQYGYDAHGNLLALTTADGRVMRYTYDKKDRLTSVTDSMGSTAYYAYDVMGNLTGITDYMGRGTRYTYDLEGNLTSVTDAAGRRESFSYDAAGRLLSHTYNSGSMITYDYDKLNRLVEKSYADAAGMENGAPAAYAYNALGERVSMYDDTGDTIYEYDSLGRIISVTTYRTPDGADMPESSTGADGEICAVAGGTGFSHAREAGDRVSYAYDDAGNLSAITYPDGTQVLYGYDLNGNLVKVTDREGKETAYVYDAINRLAEIHRPNGISTYNTYDAGDRITEIQNTCDDCGWVVSRYAYTYDERGFIVGETATESLAGYAYDEKHNGKHEDGRHDALYPHGDRHAKHDKDSTYAYRIVETVRSFTYDGAGKLLTVTETEENHGTYTCAYEYDAMGNRTAMVKTDGNGKVVESSRYVYNESSRPVSVKLYDGKKTTEVVFTYDADGNLISETGREGTEKVERSYLYTVENRLLAVYDGKELLMAAAYDGDGNRVFQLNYNLHTDGDLKGNSGNGNGSNKDNKGSGNSGNGNNAAAGENGSVTGGGSGNGPDGTGAPAETVTGTAKNNGNRGNSSANNGKGGNGKDNGNKGNDSNGNGSSGSGNATNAETNNSQNQSGILFPTEGEVSAKEEYLISLIKTSGREKDYELTEYISDVNRTYAEVLVEQNCSGAMDTAYVYGSGRISLDRFDGSTGYYLYDGRGSVTGISNGEGQVCRSYRYAAFGEITYGAPQYENIYAYNGESYSPNVGSLYLRARYYNIAAGSFFTEDSYLGDIREPLTLNRYVYCEGNPVNYKDPSGKSVENDIMKAVMSDNSISAGEKGNAIDIRIRYYHALQTINYAAATFDNVMSHDFDADIFYGGVEGVFHETLEALEARAEQMRANNTCYAIVGTDKDRLEKEQQEANAQYIYDYLINEGWTVNAICGLLGNVDEESRLNPGVWQTLNSVNGGYGLFQLTPVKDKFFYWLSEYQGYTMYFETGEETEDNIRYKMGIDFVNDLSTNNPNLLMELELEYFIWSCQASTPSDHREWFATLEYYSPYKLSYSKYIEELYSPSEMALVFHASYERSADGKEAIEERSIAAEKWYQYFMNQ